jgi:hypothetical protein
MDIGFFNPYTEQDVLGRMDEWISIITGRGVPLDAFLLDDGWDDTRQLAFGPAFSQGLARSGKKPTACTARSDCGSRRGAVTTNRATFASLMPKSMVLKPSTVNWRFRASLFKNFNEQIARLIKNEHITSFKLDGMGNANSHIQGSPFASDLMPPSPCCTTCAAPTRICLST